MPVDIKTMNGIQEDLFSLIKREAVPAMPFDQDPYATRRDLPLPQTGSITRRGRILPYDRLVIAASRVA